MCTAPGDDDGPRPASAVDEEEQTLRSGDGVALREFVALPATGFRSGAVLIIHDIWGYTDFYKDLARRITGHGHAAALVDFFGRQSDLPESMRAPERTGSKPSSSPTNDSWPTCRRPSTICKREVPRRWRVGDFAWEAASPTSRRRGY